MNIHITGFPDLVQIPVTLDGDVPDADINQGDPVAIVSGFAVGVVDFPWTTDLATTQAAFKAAFAGMSSGRSRAGTTDVRDLYVPVRQDGVDEVDVDSAAYEFGDYIGPRKNASANHMDPVFAAVANVGLATHVVAETTDGAVTKLKARIINTFPKK